MKRGLFSIFFWMKGDRLEHLKLSLTAKKSNELSFKYYQLCRSPSLRGSKHTKVPTISNQPLNTPLPVPKDGVPHPQPFYVTQV